MSIPLLAAAAVLAFFSWGTVTKWVKLPQASRAKLEQKFIQQGIMKADGTVSVDKEFDAELNAINRALNAERADGQKQLNTLERE